MMLSSEAVLVPFSLLVTIGYHAYLCHCLRRNPCLTTIGIDSINRTTWLRKLNQGDDKNGMLAVQSLRNGLMSTILTGTVTIIVILCSAALLNNTFNAFDHFGNLLFFIFSSNTSATTSTSTSTSTGLFSKMMAIKFGSAYLFLITGFLSCCMGISHLIDANFLINAIGHFSNPAASKFYTQTVLERGFWLVTLGNRIFCITFPVMLWMFGPLPMLLSSLALVCLLYHLDFPPAGLCMP